MSNNSRSPLLTCCTLMIFAFITACSDSGGGSGDTENSNIDSAASQAVAPFVGTWNLPEDWNGVENGVAYFVVRTPESNGVATAVIYDFDDAPQSNCFVPYGLPGTVSQSLGNEIFLEISEYPYAVVSLTPSSDLQIAVFAEGASSASPPERTLIATRLGFEEVDINLCEG